VSRSGEGDPDQGEAQSYPFFHSSKNIATGQLAKLNSSVTDAELDEREAARWWWWEPLPAQGRLRRTTEGLRLI
jgi:hypothetical protein